MGRIKFPLPDGAVPTLQLAQVDIERLEAVEELVVKRTVQQYHELLTHHRGVVDERQWKQIKQREDVRVYRERSTNATSRNTSSHSNVDTFASLVSILAFGSMQGELDDIVYGSLSPSLQDMRLKTAYVEDGFLDWAFVAPLIQPSATDPFRELSVKWTVTGAPAPLDIIIQGRYMLFIESVGFAHTPSGERIGYLLRHSVDLPVVHDAFAGALESAKLSTCHLFRQATADSVEVFMRGAIGAVDGVTSSLADARASLIAKVSAIVAVSVWKNFRHAEMKKLARIVQSSAAQRASRATTVTTRPHSQSSSSSGSKSAGASASCSSSNGSPYDQHGSSASCAVCTKSVHGISSRLGFSTSRSRVSSRKHCRICAMRVCSRCRVVKTVFVPSARVKDVIEESVTFCTPCLVRVNAVPAASFAALDVLVAQGHTVDYSELL